MQIEKQLVTCNEGSNFSRKDVVSANCWVSVVMGNSIWRTEPRNPNSAVNPGDGLHLSLANKIQLTRNKQGAAHVPIRNVMTRGLQHGHTMGVEQGTEFHDQGGEECRIL